MEPKIPIPTLHLLCDVGQVTPLTLTLGLPICKIEMVIMSGRVVVRIEYECVKDSALCPYIVKTQSRVAIASFPQSFHLPLILRSWGTSLRLSRGFPCIHRQCWISGQDILFPVSFLSHTSLMTSAYITTESGPQRPCTGPPRQDRPILSLLSSSFSRQSQEMGT